MPKLITPEMEAINRKNQRRSKKKKQIGNSPMMEAWKRLRRNRTAILGLVIICIHKNFWYVVVPGKGAAAYQIFMRR